MAPSLTSAVSLTMLLVACLATIQESDWSCDSETDVCMTDTQLVSAVSDYSNTDHVAYVQKRATKVTQLVDPEDRQSPAPAPPADPADVTSTIPGLDADNNADNTIMTGPGSGPDEDIHDTYAKLRWAYGPTDDNVKGPDHWWEIDGADACKQVGTQSPIDIGIKSGNWQVHPTKLASEFHLEKVPSACDTTATYVLNERTAEVEFLAPCDYTLRVSWPTFSDKFYYLKQFHYHSPSEHTFDGGFFPMEVHHVHKSDDGQTLVLATMIAVVNFENIHDKMAVEFMEDVLMNMPNISDPDLKSKANRFEVEHASPLWDPYLDFLKGHLGDGFFQYMGSFETPPCTTGTIWVIDPVPIHVPSAILTAFRTMINEVPNNQLAPFGDIYDLERHALPPWHNNSGMTEWSYLLGCNTRPVQPLGDRILWAINVSLPPSTTEAPMETAE